MKKFVLITFVGALTISCNSDELDFDNVKVQPITGEYGFPLGEVTYTMRELIDQQQDGELDLQEDSSTSLLFLSYQETFNYNVQNEFVNVGDIENTKAVDLSSILTGPTAGPVALTIDAQTLTGLEYDPQDEEELDSLFHNGGDLVVDAITDLPGTLNYTLTFNNTIDITTGTPLVVTGTVVNDVLPIGEVTATTTTPLANYKTILPEVANEFDIELTSATLTLVAGQFTTQFETLAFDITFANQTFSLIYGKFGRDTVQVGNETQAIDFFENSGDGINFGNPTISFNINNSFGVPVGLDFSTMYTDNGAGTAPTFLSGNITEDLPEVSPGNVISLPLNLALEPVNSTTEINSGNSNITDLFSISPTRFVFDVTAISNPTDLEASNFVAPGQSELDADIDVTIPMEIMLENFIQSGTLSLNGGLDVTDVDSAFIRIATINELPFSGLLTLEIQDADSNSLYTVTENLVLEAPFINIDGFVTDPDGISTDIPIDATGIEALATGSHLLLTMTLNTPPSLTSRDIFVKLTADNRLQVKIGIGVSLNIEL